MDLSFHDASQPKCFGGLLVSARFQPADCLDDHPLEKNVVV